MLISLIIVCALLPRKGGSHEYSQFLLTGGGMEGG